VIEKTAGLAGGASPEPGPGRANPILDGYHMFYETYLGVSVPVHGEIVAQTGTQNVYEVVEPLSPPWLPASSWDWIPGNMPQAYHRPVQEFLTRIDPRLRFDRNYARPPAAPALLRGESFR